MQRVFTSPRTAGGGAGHFDFIEPGYGDYGSGGGSDGSRRIRSARIGLWMLLGAIGVLFGAVVLAYVSGSWSREWRLEPHPLVFLNTAVLLASSLAVENARRKFDGFRPLAFRKWMLVTSALGAAFLAGQIYVWRSLVERDVLLDTHPESSFFYLLTGMHAVHVLLGVTLLLWVLSRRRQLLPGDCCSPGIAATYWHFMGALWVALLLVLVVL